MGISKEQLDALQSEVEEELSLEDKESIKSKIKFQLQQVAKARKVLRNTEKVLEDMRAHLLDD